MTILGIDHFTVLTTTLEESCLFYEKIIDARRGPRPAFEFSGAWLYVNGSPVIHLIETDEKIKGNSIIDHVALKAKNLSDYLEKLGKSNIPFELKRLPEGCEKSGIWQVFLRDPGGALIELCFAASEIP
jgi:catechol 2,3-dioxygenase-like lactoylglutathione lyase family enzyme